MPKKKTNRTAHKKFRVGGNGRVKRRQANTSHNTAKRAPKRMRQLRGNANLNEANLRSVEGMLPYSK